MLFNFGDEVCRPAFDYKATPVVSYGLRFPEACLKHCRDTFHSSRVYVICSQSISKQSDALTQLCSALGDRVAGVYVGIRPHTPIDQVLEVVSDAQLRNVDCIVSLGAGSITDAAKLVRLALANKAVNEDDMNTLWGHGGSNPAMREKISRPTIPLIHIPTSLSGGEYQAIAGGTESKSHAKRTFQCEGVDPELVIQDPELCLTTPQWVWLSTGIRSVDHCVETLCSLLSSENGDTWSKRGLKKLVVGLLQSKELPFSLDARHLCQTGVVEAMCAVSGGIPLGASHAIGHQLGPLGVGHGETSCILLPAVCRFNLQNNANTERQMITRKLLLQEPVIQQLLDARQLSQESDLGAILAAVITELGMPRALEDVNIGVDKFALLAKNSLNDIWIQTNAIPITQESQVMEILRMCTREAKL